MSARLVDPDLFDGYPDALALAGSRCNACGAVTFPAQLSCARCTSTDVARHPLATTGTIWGYTIQGFPPKTPYLAAEATFTPFGVGYVELGGEVLVETRIVSDALDRLHIGMPVELVLEPFHHDADGTAVLTFAFSPTRGQA